MRGSKNVGKCDVGRFFVDDSDIASKIDQRFLLIKNNRLQILPISELVDQVNVRSVVLNLY